MTTNQRVLIYRLGSLGDTLIALPALRLVASAFPDAERWMLTNISSSIKAAPMAEVLENTGLVDGFIEYPLGLRNPVHLLALIRRIRCLRPNVLVYLASPRGILRAWRDVLFFRLCGIRQIIGVPLTHDLQQVRFLDESYEAEGGRLVRCIAMLGDTNLNDPSAFGLPLNEADCAQARAALGDLADGRPILSISIGAKVDVKDWGDVNWLSLLKMLRGSLPGWGLVILGTVDERERADRLLKVWRDDAINLCGRLAIRASAAVLSRSRLLVCHDSGPMHLAAAVGTQCVAIFSSRNLPGEWFPYGALHRVMYRPMSCQGCRLDICLDRDKACIRSITVEDVLVAVEAALTTNS